MMSMASQVSLIATSNSGGQTTPWTVPNPPGHQVGDAVLIVMSDDQLANSSNMSTNFLYGPNGFTQIPIQQTSNVDGQQLGIFVRVLDGTEGNTFSAQCAVSCSWVAEALLFRGVDANVPMGSFACYINDVAFTTTSNVTTPPIFVSDAGSALVWVNCPDWRGSTAANTTIPPGFTSIGPLSELPAAGIEVGVKTGTSPGLVPALTGTINPSGSSCAAMATVVAIRPPIRRDPFLADWYGTPLPRIMFIGDDAMEGAGASIRENRALDILARQLTNLSPASSKSYDMYLPAVYACAPTGQTVATPWGGMWASSTTGTVTPQLDVASGFGFGMRSISIANNSSATYSVYAASTIYVYFAPSDGLYSYSIDGGAFTAPLPLTGFTGIQGSEIAVASTGTHTVTISSSNGTVNFCGFLMQNGGSSIIYDCSHTGSIVTDHYDVNNPSASQNTLFTNAVSTAIPSLVVINLGANDMKVISPTQLQTNMAGMISAIRSVSNASIALIAPYQVSAWDDTTAYFGGFTAQQYDVAMNALAISNNVARFHLTPPMPVAFTDTSNTYASDRVHLTDMGHALLANTLGTYLFPRPTSGQTFGKFTHWDPTRANSSITFTDSTLAFNAPSSNVCMAALDITGTSTASIYWEVTLSQCFGLVQLGLMPESQTNFGTSLGAVGLAYGNDGSFTSNGTVVSTGNPGFSVGDTVTFALINGSLWAGTAKSGWVGNPAANTGALVTGLTGSYTAAFGMGSASFASGLANFGNTFWRGTIPVGCTGWKLGSSVVYAAYDPISKSVNAVLSNNNMTLSQTSASAWDRVASTLSLEGKVYFEGILNNTETSAQAGFGVMQYSGGTLSQTFVGADPSGTDVGLYLVPESGVFYVFWNDTNISTPEPSFGSATNPYHVGIAVDSSTRQVWLRVVWAGGASVWAGGGDPAANTSATATLTGTSPLYAAGAIESVADQVTIVSNPANFVGTIPTGFVGGISNIPPPLDLTGTPPSGSVGTAYSYTFVASGGTPPITYALTSGAFPAGLTMTSAGVLSGTPTTVATSSFAVTATDSTNTPSVLNTSIAIAAAPPMTLTGTLANGTVGVAYSNTLALGGTFVAPVTIDTSAGTLPSWMSSSVSGSVVTFSGTPSTAATSTFTVRATDSTTPTAQVATSPQSVTIAAVSNTFATFNPLQVTYGYAISNNGLTIACGSSSGGGSIIPTANVASSVGGKYFEATINSIQSGGMAYVGWALPSWAGGYPPGYNYEDPPQSFAFMSNGTMQYGQKAEGSTGISFGAGDTVMLYFAAGGGVYLGKVGTGWSAGHVPGTGTPLFTLNAGNYLAAAGGRATAVNGVQITCNFGASAWLGTPPTGATGWTG